MPSDRKAPHEENEDQSPRIATTQTTWNKADSVIGSKRESDALEGRQKKTGEGSKFASLQSTHM